MFSGIGLLGVYAGVSLIVLANPRAIQIGIGIFILCLIIYTLLKKDIGLKEKKICSKTKRFTTYLFAPFLGFYEGTLGSGNGILFSVLTLNTRGFDFIDALGYHFATVFPWEVFVAAFFISKGYFSWSVTIPMVLGSIIGGYIGSNYAKYKGNRFIKTMLVIRSILGLKLLIGL